MNADSLGRAVIAHLQGWLRAFQEEEAALDQRRDEVIAQGLRVVNGGQTGPWNAGSIPVEYTDDTTGEVLFRGNVTDPGEAWQERWFHVDRLHDDVPLPDHPVDPSLPAPVQDLLEALDQKCLDLEADGIRAIIGLAASLVWLATAAVRVRRRTAMPS